MSQKQHQQATTTHISAERGADVSHAGVDNAQAEQEAAKARLRLHLPWVPKAWKDLGKDLFSDVPTLSQLPDEAAFRAGAYKLIAELHHDVAPMRQVLGCSADRKPYLEALDDVDRCGKADAAHLKALEASAKDLAAGGQITFNTRQLLAHYGSLSPLGRGWVAAAPMVGTTLTPYVNGGECHRHGVLEKTAAFRGTELELAIVHASQAYGVQRVEAVRRLMLLLTTGSISGTPSETPVVANGEAKVGPDSAPTPEAQAIIDAEVAKLTARIRSAVLHGKKRDGVRTVDDKTFKELTKTLEAAAPQVRDRIYGDRDLMHDLTQAGDARQVQELVHAVDSVEALYQACLQITLPPDPNGLRAAPHMTKKPFELVRDYLLERAAPEQRDARMRLLRHEQLKTRAIDPMIDADRKLIFRLIARGTMEPTAEDRIHDAATAGDGPGMARALMQLASAQPALLQGLKEDQQFWQAIKQLDREILVDGLTVNPYHLCLTMWGLEPQSTADPGADPLQGMVNLSGDNRPLTIDENIKLEDELFNPTIRSLYSEFDETIVDDDDCVSILRHFEEKAAQQAYSDLLHRSRQAPGPTLEKKYNAAHKSTLRNELSEYVEGNQRLECERVVGVRLEASVGTIGGAARLASDKDQGAMPLEQALRDTLHEGKPLTQHVSRCVDAFLEATRVPPTLSGMAMMGSPPAYGDVDDTLSAWHRWRDIFNADNKARISGLTGIPQTSLHAIELLSNAFRMRAGELGDRMNRCFSGKERERVLGDMGLRPEDVGERQLAGSIETMKTDPAAAIGMQADMLFKVPAQEIFEAIATLPRELPAAAVEALAGKLDAAMAKAVAPPSDAAAAAQMATIAEDAQPRNFESYYRKHYGIDVKLHIARVLSASPGTAAIGAVASRLHVDSSLIRRDIALPSDAPVITEANRHLVRPDFSEARAVALGTQIWEVLHGSGEVHLIMSQLYGKYTPEEQRLISVAFRRLSGGIDIAFYVRQEMLARKEGSELVKVGGEGTSEGQAAVGGKTELHVTGDESKLDSALMVATTGELDNRARLKAAVANRDMNQIFRVCDDCSEAECRRILGDSELMAATFKICDQYAWDRVSKTLSGQSDLMDRLYSRAHGAYDSWNPFDCTDEAGIREDVKSYVQRLRRKFDKELRASAKGGDPKQLEEAIKQKVRVACQQLMANPNVRGLIESELSYSELGEVEGMILNAGEDSTKSDVARDGEDASNIIAGIRTLKPAQKQALRNDPQYLEKLAKNLPRAADYREAMDLLASDQESGGALAELDKAVNPRGDEDQDNRGAMRSMLALSEAEFRALAADPDLQANLLASIDDPQQRAMVRDMLALRLPETGAKLSDADKEAQADRSRLAYLEHTAVQRIRFATTLGWDTMLAQCVEVFKMDFEPTPAKPKPGAAGGPPPDLDAATAAGKAAATRTRRAVWAAVEDEVAAFAGRAAKDSRNTMSKMSDPGAMTALIKAAILGDRDPSAERINENLVGTSKLNLGDETIDYRDAGDNDQKGLLATINAASPALLIKEWSSVHQPRPDGGDSMHAVYHRYRETDEAVNRKLEASKQTATPEGTKPASPLTPAERAAHEQHQLAFLNYVPGISAEFEQKLLPYVGTENDATASGKAARTREDLRARDNKKYNELLDAITSRTQALPKSHTSQVASELGIESSNRAHLQLVDNQNRETLGQLELREQKYLQQRGTQAGSGWAASAEAEALDQAMVRYSREAAVAQVDLDGKDDAYGMITAAEGAKVEEKGAEFDRAHQAFKDAKAKVAMWMSLIIGTLVTCLLTVLTGGAATGFAAMLFWSAVTAGASAAAKAAINEAVLGSDYDFSDEGVKMIGKEMLTAIITAGTTFVAQKMVAGVSGMTSLSRQARGAEQALRSHPPLWKSFLNEGSEEILSETMSGTIEAGLVAIDPSHWMHGVVEGQDRALPEAWAKLKSVPGNALRGGVTSIVTAGATRLLGKKSKQLHQLAAQHKGKKRVNIKENFAEVFGDQRGAMIATFTEFAINKLGGEKFDLESVPGDLLEGYLQEMNEKGTEVHTASASKGNRTERATRDVQKYQHLMTPQERHDFVEMNTAAQGTDTYITPAEYVGVRHQMASDALGAWSETNQQAVTPAQAQAFVMYVRAAKDGDDLQARLSHDPRLAEAANASERAGAFDPRKRMMHMPAVTEQAAATSQAPSHDQTAMQADPREHAQQPDAAPGTKHDEQQQARPRPQEWSSLAQQGRKMTVDQALPFLGHLYGLQPKHTLTVGNATYHMTDLFDITDGRMASVAVVEVDGVFSVQVFYRSNSQAGWRLMPAMNFGVVSGDRQMPIYDKGASEHALNLPTAVQAHLSGMAQSGQVQLAIKGSAGEDLLTHVLPVNRSTKDYKAYTNDADFVGKHVHGASIIDPSTGDTQHGKKPNFGTPIRTFQSKTSVAGAVDALVYASHDGSVEYTVYKDADDHIWIGEVSAASAAINKHGVSSVAVEAPARMMVPLWEYAAQIPDGQIGAQNQNNGDYFSAWGYLRQQPEIQAWYQANGVAMPSDHQVGSGPKQRVPRADTTADQQQAIAQGDPRFVAQQQDVDRQRDPRTTQPGTDQTQAVHQGTTDATAHVPPPRHVATDFADLAHMTRMHAAIIAGHQVSRAEAMLASLSESDYRTFQSIHAALQGPTAQAFLYKALAAGNSIGEIQWFASYMIGKPDAWLVDHLTLGDFRGQGIGVQQQWSMSCNASTTITLRGNYDPVFALKVRLYNPDINKVDYNDPTQLNASLAGMEKGLLESAYQGDAFPALQGMAGEAKPIAQGAARGRFADDLLNAQRDATGLSFTTRTDPTPAEAVEVLQRALAQGLQVPVVVGDFPKAYTHYVLCQAMQFDPSTGEAQFQFHNTGSGTTTWVTATQIATGTMGLAGGNRVTVLEVPSVAPPQVRPVTAPPATAASAATTQVIPAQTAASAATTQVIPAQTAASAATTQVIPAQTAASAATTQVIPAQTAASAATTQVMQAQTAASAATTQVMPAQVPDGVPVATADEVTAKHAVDGVPVATADEVTGKHLTTSTAVDATSTGPQGHAQRPAAGLRDVALTGHFVSEMKALASKWSSMSLEGRANEIHKVINDHLSVAGVPAVAMTTAPMSANGQMSVSDWEVTLNEAKLSANSIDMATLGELANVAYHEARHAEQYYLVARYLVERGMMPSEIESHTGLPEGVCVKAFGEARMSPQQSAEAATYYESLHGSGATYRNAVLSKLDPLWQKAAAARAEAERVVRDPAVPLRERDAKIDAWKAAQKLAEYNHAKYMALPEEVDAFAAGDAVGAAFQGAPPTSAEAPSSVAASTEAPRSEASETARAGDPLAAAPTVAIAATPEASAAPVTSSSPTAAPTRTMSDAEAQYWESEARLEKKRKDPAQIRAIAEAEAHISARRNAAAQAATSSAAQTETAVAEPTASPVAATPATAATTVAPSEAVAPAAEVAPVVAARTESSVAPATSSTPTAAPPKRKLSDAEEQYLATEARLEQKRKDPAQVRAISEAEARIRARKNGTPLPASVPHPETAAAPAVAPATGVAAPPAATPQQSVAAPTASSAAVAATPAAPHITENPAPTAVAPEARSGSEIATQPIALPEVVAAAQAAPAPRTASTREGLDALNSEGAYDYRMQKVAGLRQDIMTGSETQISPDVSPEMAGLAREHIGQVTDEQLAAIQGYTSQDFDTINRVLRSPDSDPAQTAQLGGYIASVRGGLAGMPSYEGEVYRGSAISQDLFARWQQAYAEGGTIADPAFVSSSKDASVAMDFLSQGSGDVPVFCKIQSRNGKQVEFLSKTPQEAEVLFDAGTRFKVEYIVDETGADGKPYKEVMLREVVEPSRDESADQAQQPGTSTPATTTDNALADTNSIALFTVGEVPQGGRARREYLKDTSHWTPERAALHQALLASAVADAQAFADAAQQGDPTIYAMRGNTAAGKSRAIKGNISALEGPTAATATRQHRAVNPDNFKQDLIKATSGGTLTTQQVHEESSMLASRLEAALLHMRTSDGTESASILIDKRLAFAEDVDQYRDMAKDTGRKLNVYDVDAPLEVSLAGVLERQPDGPDPLPPFHIVADGFTAVRADRQAIVDKFVADPSLGTYELYGTRPDGAKIKVAAVVNGALSVLDADMYAEVTRNPQQAAEALGDTPITAGTIAEITASLAPERAARVAAILQPYVGQTWRAALDTHASAKPAMELPGGGTSRPGPAPSPHVEPVVDTATEHEASPTTEVRHESRTNHAEVENQAKGEGLPEFAISIDDLEADNDERGNYFAVVFTGRTSNGRDLHMGNGSVSIDKDGNPVGAPSFELLARCHHDGQDYAIKIYDEVVPASDGQAAVGKGKPISFTAFALKKFIARYRSKFQRDPDELGGTLADLNKRNYQREYVKLLDKNVSEDVAKVEAAKKISYGVHRIDAGYTEFDVVIGKPERVDLGDLGTRLVPTSVRVSARRR